MVQLSILPFQLFESPILSNHSWNTVSQFPNDVKTSQVGIIFSDFLVGSFHENHTTTLVVLDESMAIEPPVTCRWVSLDFQFPNFHLLLRCAMGTMKLEVCQGVQQNLNFQLPSLYKLEFTIKFWQESFKNILVDIIDCLVGLTEGKTLTERCELF